jgi:hypothetical protein
MRLADSISRLERLSPEMRGALLASLEVENPILEVPEWARLVRDSTSTLERRFKGRTGAARPAPQGVARRRLAGFRHRSVTTSRALGGSDAGHRARSTDKRAHRHRDHGKPLQAH